MFSPWVCKLRPSLLLDFSNNNFSGSIPRCLSNYYCWSRNAKFAKQQFQWNYSFEYIRQCYQLSVAWYQWQPVGGRISKVTDQLRFFGVFFLMWKAKESKTRSILVEFSTVIKWHDPPSNWILRALVSSSCLHWVSKFKTSLITISMELCWLSIFSTGVKWSR